MPEAGAEPEFRTSSFSGGGSCIEVARLAVGRVLLRDSKDRRVTISVGNTGWSTFLAGLRDDRTTDG